MQASAATVFMTGYHRGARCRERKEEKGEREIEAER